jgi:hypothetical protein
MNACLEPSIIKDHAQIVFESHSASTTMVPVSDRDQAHHLTLRETVIWLSRGTHTFSLWGWGSAHANQSARPGSQNNQFVTVNDLLPRDFKTTVNLKSTSIRQVWLIVLRPHFHELRTGRAVPLLTSRDVVSRATTTNLSSHCAASVALM